MTKRLVIDVDSERVEMEVHDEFNMNVVRELVANLVKQALGFDEYENRVYVCVKVYGEDGD